MVASLLAGWSHGRAGRDRFSELTPDALALRAADAVMVSVHGLMIRRALVPDVDADALVDDLLVGWD